MQTVEIRRHSLRTPPEADLSPDGIDLARIVGAGLPHFHLVVSSPAARAVQTVRALGLQDPRVEPLWEELGTEVSRELPWPTTFRLTRQAVRDARSAAHARSQELWSALGEHLSRVPEGGALFVVTHGGFPELVVAGSGLPTQPAEEQGPIRCLEGVRFSVAEGRALDCSILRLPDGLTRV